MKRENEWNEKCETTTETWNGNFSAEYIHAQMAATNFSGKLIRLSFEWSEKERKLAIDLLRSPSDVKTSRSTGRRGPIEVQLSLTKSRVMRHSLFIALEILFASASTRQTVWFSFQFIDKTAIESYSIVHVKTRTRVTNRRILGTYSC